MPWALPISRDTRPHAVSASIEIAMSSARRNIQMALRDTGGRALTLASELPGSANP